MFAVQMIVDASLLRANKIPLLLLSAAFILFFLMTVILTVRAVRREKQFAAQADHYEASAEDRRC